MTREGAGDAPDGAIEVDSSLLDPTSGLFAEPFFLATVGWRLVACRRMLRPLALVLFEVVEGLPDGPVRAADPQVVAKMLRATLRASDLGARMGDGTYGLLLEDTPEDGAVWCVERLRRSVVTRRGRRSLRAGVACYPGQALTPVELVTGARRALTAAQEWPQDRIEVAPAPG